ncbi:hypothetical protein ACRTAO_001127 [Clostridium perfringens]
MNLNSHFKGEKLNIHMFYWILILVLIIIGLITTRSYSNESLSEQVAFGATLSGIILSVIAIIMTLIGETKSDNTKDKLLNLSDDLENIVNDIKNTTSNLECLVQSNIELKKGITEISCALSQVTSTSKEENLSEQDIEESKYYLKVFKLFIENQAEVLKKYVFIAFTYIYLIKNAEPVKVSYKKFNEDMNSLDSINFNEQMITQSIWGMFFIFSGAFKFKEFTDYIEDYTEKNYSKEYYEVVTKFSK